MAESKTTTTTTTATPTPTPIKKTKNKKQASTSTSISTASSRSSRPRPRSISISKARSRWDQMFELLSTFKHREGDLNVPYSHIEDGQNLGTWLVYQRKLKKAGTLQKYKHDKLEDIAGGFIWEEKKAYYSRSRQWDSMLSLLIQYKDREGDCYVPQNHIEKPGNQNLGTWLDRQRQAKVKGKLHPTKQKQLEDVGVAWEGVSSQRWEDIYQRLVLYKTREGNCYVPQSYKDKDGKNIGTWLNTQRQSKKCGTLDPALEQRLESIGVTWEVSSPQWDGRFSLLVEYKKREGDCNVPREYKVVDAKNGKQKQLGRWLDRQRQYKKTGTLDTYRQSKLESIGVVWDKVTHQWEEMYTHLVQYNEREGDCNVPKQYKTSKDNGGRKNLGAWLDTQRQSKRNGNLDPTKEQRLETLGVEWDIYSKEWKEMYALLVQYKEREGECLVPQNHKEGDKNLGIWLNYQRSKKKTSSLDEDQFRDLEEIGVVWDVVAAQWDEMVALLVQYKERKGNCRVPQTHKEDGKNLGTWVYCQRQSKRAGTLDTVKEKQLEEIGVVWDILTHKWDEMFAFLVQYQQREGDCMVPQNHKENGKGVGIWLDTQRQFQKNGNLDSTKEGQLVDIGVVWDVLPYKWEEMFSRLVQYKQREGDCNIPPFHKEDEKKVGMWLNRQRQLKKTGKLDAALQRRLEDTGVVWNMNEQKWENMFALLVQYDKREGHCRVPQDHKEGDENKSLGNWLDNQRQKKKNGRLDAALQTRLKNLGVKWNIYAKFDDGDDNWGFEGMDHLFDDNMFD